MIEKILCAAIRFPGVELTASVYKVKNMGTDLVLCGHRHHHVIGQWVTLTGKSLPGGAIQGFLTSKNNFVTREEAMKMFKSAGGQRDDKDTYISIDFFSEDLY